MSFGGSNNAAGSSLTLTGVTLGATILVWPISSGGNATAFTVSDGQGSYSSRGPLFGTSGDSNSECFILTNANAGSHVISAGITGDTIFGLIAAWWSGVGDVDNSLAAINQAVVTGSATGANALNSGNLTTSSSNCTIVGIAFGINGVASTLSAGTSPNAFTQRAAGTIGGAVPFVVEDFAQIAAGAIAATAGSTAVINAVTQGIGLAPASAGPSQGIALGAHGPGRSPGKTSARFQQLKLSTVNPSNSVSGAFTGASASAAAFPLTATGLLAFTGSSASSASFGLSASIAFLGASASGAIVPVGGGIGIRGSSASSANFAPAVNIGLTGASASSATFSLSGAIAFSGVSASTALFNATAVGPGSNFTGVSTSAASFDLSASPGLLAFKGASASSAVVDASGSIGLLTFNGVSASVAVVDVQGLTSGSIFFSGASASSASLQITGPFTPPALVSPSGALLPGVKTAIELERGFKYPWQATGAPIVPSPYMGASESLAPITPIEALAPQVLHVEQFAPIAPTQDEAVLLLLLLAASL